MRCESCGANFNYEIRAHVPGESENRLLAATRSEHTAFLIYMDMYEMEPGDPERGPPGTLLEIRHLHEGTSMTIVSTTL